jgi:hypothetical protein
MAVCEGGRYGDEVRYIQYEGTGTGTKVGGVSEARQYVDVDVYKRACGN